MPSDLGSWCSRHKGMITIALAALIMIAYFIFPFLDGVILGTVFAYVGRPIRDKFGQKKRLGSLLAAICIVVPMLLILGLGMLEIANQIIMLAHNQEVLRIEIGSLIEETARDLPPAINDIFARSLENIASITAPIAASIPVFYLGRVVSLGIINFIISIPVCYFMLADGEGFVESIISFLPEKEMEVYRKYITRIDHILSGIFIGTIYTSILGSIIAAFMFYAFDLPRPFALASIVFIAGMVPFFTSWLVIIPAAIYEYVNDGLIESLTFFILASILIYFPSELLIRPYLVSSKSSLHPLLVLLSFLGGALVAGIAGFFLAPAVMGVIIGIYQVRSENMAANRSADDLTRIAREGE